MNNEQNNNLENITSNPVTLDNNQNVQLESTVINSAAVENNAPQVDTNLEPLMQEVTLVPEEPQVTPIAPESTIQASSEEPRNKKGKNKIVLSIIIILAIIVVAVGGYIGYLFIGVSPQKVHEKVIDKVFANVDNFANNLMINNYKEDTKTLKSVSTVSFDTNIDELDMLNNYSLKLETGLDKVNNYANIKMNLLEKNKDLLGLNYYLVNDKAYIDSKDLYDKTILIGEYEINISDLLDNYASQNNNNNVNHLLNTLKIGIKNSLDKEKYERKLENVKLNGKEVKAFNNSYVIDEAGFYSILKSILSAYRNDAESIKIITDTFGSIADSISSTSDSIEANITTKDIEEMLDSLIKELSDPELTGSTDRVYFNIYTSMISNEVIGIKLIAKSDMESITIVEYSIDGDISNLRLSIDDANTFVYEATTKNDTTDYKIIISDEPIITGTVISSDNKFEMTFVLDVSLFSSDGPHKFTLKISAESKENSSTIKFKFGIEQNGEVQEVSMKIDTTVTYDESITKPNVSNAVELENVDEDKLYDNLQKALENSELYDLITSDYLDAFDGYDYGFNDDYDYDFDDDFNDDFFANIYSEHCDEASNCKCSGDECTCRYLNDDFKYEDVICPNPNI